MFQFVSQVFLAGCMYLCFILLPNASAQDSKSSLQAEHGGISIDGSVVNSPITVRDNHGGIVINGSVVNSPITIGVPQEKLEELISDRTKELSERTEEQKQLIESLQNNLQINRRQLETALNIVGERDIPPERIADTLVEVAQRFKALQEQLTVLQAGGDAQVQALKGEAERAIAAGNLKEADALLDQMAKLQKNKLERQAENLAETLARRGDIASTELRYPDAAKRFGEAADAVSVGGSNEDKRLAYLDEEADALVRQGSEFGDREALAVAIDRRKKLITMIKRDQFPLQWGAIQSKLCNAFGLLGGRIDGKSYLEEAVTACREALKEWTLYQSPLLWGQTQSYLGNALREIGMREKGTRHLEEAVAAFRDGLKKMTRDQVPFQWPETRQAPFQWATAQNDFGVTLRRLGEREKSPKHLEEAVAAFREALKVRTRKNAPYDWAATQSNLGNTLRALGKREKGTKRLEEAVAAFREALAETPRDRLPLQWATIQLNLGVALETLGEREKGTRRLEEAAAAFREALAETPRDRLPLHWVKAQIGLCIALEFLGERDKATTHLDEAVGVCREVMNEFTKEALPDGYHVAQKRLKRATALLARWK